MVDKRKIRAVGAFFLALIFCFAFSENAYAAVSADKKITVIATLFPQYDFARQIAGTRAEITMLLHPGVESHSYEPTPADIVKINRADLFLYTGDHMEHWAGRIIKGFAGEKKPLVVDVSKGVALSREGHSGAHEGHAHVYDPHIWTDPNNAVTMAGNILAGLIAVDPGHAEEYRANAKKYFKELKALDRDFKNAVASGKRREIVLGGRNALHYFMERYGIKAVSAYDSCAADAEPSVRTVALLTDEMKNKGIPVVYYEELQVPRIARTLSGETGAKMLLFHSCHNVSKAEFDAGVTYLSLMRQNLKNLEAGLR